MKDYIDRGSFIADTSEKERVIKEEAKIAKEKELADISSGFYKESVDAICFVETYREEICCPNCRRSIQIERVDNGRDTLHWMHRAEVLEDRLRQFCNNDNLVQQIIFFLCVSPKLKRQKESNDYKTLSECNPLQQKDE